MIVCGRDVCAYGFQNNKSNSKCDKKTFSKCVSAQCKLVQKQSRKSTIKPDPDFCVLKGTLTPLEVMQISHGLSSIILPVYLCSSVIVCLWTEQHNQQKYPFHGRSDGERRAAGMQMLWDHDLQSKPLDFNTARVLIRDLAYRDYTSWAVDKILHIGKAKLSSQLASEC